MPDSAGTIGGRIAQARLDAGAKRGRTFTQTELGRLVGVASATVSQWESGAGNPTLPNVERLAAVLGVSPGWLAFGERVIPTVEELAAMTGARAPKERPVPIQQLEREAKPAAKRGGRKRA